MLAELLDLTAASIVEGRPLFPNLLSEPSFYRKYFRPWVRDGITEMKASIPHAAE